MPLAGALTTVYSRFSSACASVAFACSTRACADEARARMAVTCSGRGLRALQGRARLLLAGRGLRLPALRQLDAGFGLDDLRVRGVGRPPSARPPPRRRASNCCCETSSFASRPRRRSTSRAVRVAFASASRSRACAAVSRARATSISRADASAAPRACSTDPCAALTLLVAVVDVIGTLLCAAIAARFGIGQLGPRLVHGDLIVARIELHEHGAGFDQLVVRDRHLQHRAADARRHRRHVRIHLRIVGRLAALRQPPPGAGADDGGEDERRRGRESGLSW